MFNRIRRDFTHALCLVACLLLVSPMAISAKEPVAPFVELDLAPQKASGLSTFSNQTASTSLLFLGTQHTFDEANPQIADIERLFQKFAPSVVLTEGGEWEVAISRREAIRMGGELGFATFLASRRNVPVRSLEPKFEDEIVSVLSVYAATDVKLFYALRMVSQFKRQQSALSLNDRMNQLLGTNEALGLPKLSGSPRSADELNQILKSRYPDLPDWQSLDPWRDGRYPVEKDGVPLMDRIAKSSATFRNVQMTAVIKANLKIGSRVLVVAGTSHLAALMPALQ